MDESELLSMVFAHGFGCDQNVWRYLEPKFAPFYRTVTFTYPGSGDATPDPQFFDTHHRLDDFAEDLIAVCDEQGVRGGVLVAHSVSGMIGAIASLRRPDLFSRLVMLCPSPRYANDPPDYFGGFEASDIDGLLSLMPKDPMAWASFLAPLVSGYGREETLTVEFVQQFCRVNPAAAYRFGQVTFQSDCRDLLPKIVTPTLLVQCRDDDIVPLHIGELMRDQMPSATLEVLRIAGHCPHMSHPELTFSTIQAYLGTRDQTTESDELS